jgi:hypothetical protein
MMTDKYTGMASVDIRPIRGILTNSTSITRLQRLAGMGLVGLKLRATYEESEFARLPANRTFTDLNYHEPAIAAEAALRSCLVVQLRERRIRHQTTAASQGVRGEG